MSDDYTSDWIYWVTLDGDFAREYSTAEAAEHARLHERGGISPEWRVIWRERTELQNVYPVREAKL